MFLQASLLIPFPLDRDNMYQTNSWDRQPEGTGEALPGPDQANYMRSDAFQLHHGAGSQRMFQGPGEKVLNNAPTLSKAFYTAASLLSLKREFPEYQASLDSNVSAERHSKAKCKLFLNYSCHLFAIRTDNWANCKYVQTEVTETNIHNKLQMNRKIHLSAE